MTHAERQLVDTYLVLFESLSAAGKFELLEKFVKSLRKDAKTKKEDFFESFGAFVSDKPAEEIAKDLKSSRKFREKDLKL